MTDGSRILNTRRPKELEIFYNSFATFWNSYTIKDEIDLTEWCTHIIDDKIDKQEYKVRTLHKQKCISCKDSRNDLAILWIEIYRVSKSYEITN